MKKTISIVIILALVSIGIYFGFKSSVIQVNNPQQPIVSNSNIPAKLPPPPPSIPSAPSVTIGIKNFSFTPGALSIKAGTKVTWVNNDTVAHTVTADSGNLFDSNTLVPGQVFSFTFSAPGSVAYHCAIHPMMKGIITVTK